MQNNEQPKIWDTQNLEQKKILYSSVAKAYNQTRPTYPIDIINRVVKLTELPENATILELGCGPGTATKDFAKLGFSMVCLEPNQEFYQIAKQNLAKYPNVKIINTSFEEWELETERFDAVLAATSFHWISAEIRCKKVAATLKENGLLILLWNTGVLPENNVSEVLKKVYKKYAPSLAEYETKESQKESLNNLMKTVINSGYLTELISEHSVCEIEYKLDEYLLLLNTYSPYLQIDSEKRDLLFKGLRDKIEDNFGSSLKLSFLSIFQLLKKIK